MQRLFPFLGAIQLFPGSFNDRFFYRKNGYENTPLNYC